MQCLVLKFRDSCESKFQHACMCVAQEFCPLLVYVTWWIHTAWTAKIIPEYRYGTVKFALVQTMRAILS